MQNRKLLYCLVALSLAGLSTSLTSCKKQSEVKAAQEETVQIRLQAKDLQINRAKIGAECRAHRECEAGQACIESVCKSMDHLSCRTNLDCPDYERCFDGRVPCVRKIRTVAAGSCAVMQAYVCPIGKSTSLVRKHRNAGPAKLVSKGNVQVFASLRPSAVFGT